MNQTGTPSDSRGSGSSGFRRWLGPLLIFAGFVAMLIWTRGTWLDPIVDFGRELYVPWQITQGKVLSRDLVAIYGPLSSYVNATWFTLFGVGLRTLVFCNLVICLLLLFVLHQILVAISSRFAATIGCLVFVLLFGFVQYAQIGNFNYVCPYSHETVHGIFLSLVAMYCLMRFQRRARGRYLAASGLCLGLVFLTKPEMFAAAAPALFVGLVLVLHAQGAGQRRSLALLFVGMAFVAPIIALILLWTAMPFPQALRATLGSWPHVMNSQLTSMPYFRHGMGTDDVGGNVLLIVKVAGWDVMALAPVAGLALLLRARQSVQAVCAVAAFLVVAISLGFSWQEVDHNTIARPLPLIMLGIGIGASIVMIRRRTDTAQRQRAILQLVVAVFAFLLLMKIILFARLYHYGFVLAMPATMLTIALLFDWIPNMIARMQGSRLLFQAVALACLCVIVKLHLQDANVQRAGKSMDFGNGVNQFRIAPETGSFLGRTMYLINNRRSNDSTFLAVPEGPILNYLLGMPNPVPYLTYLPSDYVMFGEAPMLDALKAHPPDFIALLARNTADSGYSYFGVDYFRNVLSWIQSHYERVAQLEDSSQPNPRRFFIWVYEKKSTDASSSADH